MHDEADKADTGNGERGGGNAGVQQEVPLITFPLRDSHRRDKFGAAKSPEVERFLKELAPDLVRRNLCGVYVLQDPADHDTVWGYYSLSSSQILREHMSNKHRSSLGRRSAPMAFLGYMGRDDRLEKGKYGKWLVQDAARRAIKAREHIGIWGMMLEAENKALAAWYARSDVGGFKTCPAGANIDPARPLMYNQLEAFPTAVRAK